MEEGSCRQEIVVEAREKERTGGEVQGRATLWNRRKGMGLDEERVHLISVLFHICARAHDSDRHSVHCVLVLYHTPCTGKKKKKRGLPDGVH